MRTLKHWTKFRGKPNSYLRSSGLRVTMGPRGDIYMNIVGWEAFGCPEAVELMFDEGRRVIGIKKVEAWQEYSFPVRHKKHGGKVIHASPFSVDIRVRPKRTIVFNDAHIDEDGILSLPLGSVTAVSCGSK